MRPASLSVALAMATAATVAQADHPGLRIADMPMPHHGASTRVAIWYPATGATQPVTYAENPVFRGVASRPDAPVAAGDFPVVLFSHGMGGTDRAQAWLASELARRGAIVVVVNHPHSTWGDFDMRKGVRHWTRAADMSAALDQLIADPVLGPHVDPSRIMAAGFSYGGWTALSLGGMTGNLDGIVDACTAHRDTMEACPMLLSDDVALQAQDPVAWNASHADPRVTQVAAIDPGFVWGLDAADAAALRTPVLLVGLGGAQTRMLATDFDRSGLADLLPDAQVMRVDPAFHFTMMPLCTPQGAAILAADKDDPVCTDPAGTDRAAVHAAVVGALSQALGL
ncbi:MAG: hypothetical protein MUF73_13605 [Rhodobacteraceae bacterium]|jgi:predicted dienelactone hydrolase|nr:hypothetical protein [Paracoccaceae bacterium]